MQYVENRSRFRALQLAVIVQLAGYYWLIACFVGIYCLGEGDSPQGSFQLCMSQLVETRDPWFQSICRVLESKPEYRETGTERVKSMDPKTSKEQRDGRILNTMIAMMLL